METRTVNVLEEVVSQNITKEHVLQRIDDWRKRIENLYGAMEAWLSEGWKAAQIRTVRMDSDMMRHVGVEPRQLPVLDIVSPNGGKVTIEPRALWIIGANGRLDLYAGERHFVITDRADNFAPPEWKIADFNERGQLQPLDRDSFLNALGA